MGRQLLSRCSRCLKTKHGPVRKNTDEHGPDRGWPPARVRAGSEREIVTASTCSSDVVFAVAISDSLTTPAARPALASRTLRQLFETADVLS
jgi:hypothetical protein